MAAYLCGRNVLVVHVYIFLFVIFYYNIKYITYQNRIETNFSCEKLLEINVSLFELNADIVKF